jgi:hypothetical protein
MRVLLAVLLASACGGSKSSAKIDGGTGNRPDGSITPTADAGPPAPDATPRTDAGTSTMGSVTGDIRVDHMGWRTADSKIGVLLGYAGATVELHSAADNSLVASYTASGLTTDDDSGDMYSIVDFSAVQTAGDYYLYLPADNLRSYTFRIADDTFRIAGAVAMKSFYYQRCNHDKVAPYATDALLGVAGLGGQWLDAACHTGDSAATAGPGSADHGALDLHGGWHDAGDYQKTLWGRGVPEMLFAYEMNPGSWTDGQLDLPESSNGVPDILDELAWELDFYVRMQQSDGHFMTSVKGNANNTQHTSPPSTNDEVRVYFDGTSPDGNGWSGGLVTIAAATGNAVLSLAHAAIVYASPDATRAATYRAAALSGWSYLAAQTLTDTGELRLRAAAAAAVYRMDPTVTSAQNVVEGFAWGTWDGQIGGAATPGEGVIAAGAWHILANSAADSTLQATVKDAVSSVIVDGAFSQSGAYGGMFGGAGNGWDYSWGSNRAQSEYGANLMMAAHFGVLSSHTNAEVVARAEAHLHYILGLNPLDMVYLTNMAAYGGEHSSFQLYHGWFSYTDNDGDHGNATYNGEPSSVDDPLYPYFPADSQRSTYGPAPGLLVGGPNYYYDASYTLPANRNFPAYAYRDFSVGCDWDGAQCLAQSWELTEPDDGYQGPFILLASFFM